MSTTTERSATYREVFANREYRAVFGSSALSWLGDYFARIAVSALVFTDTGSVLLSAAAFAVGYLPWVAGGPVLSAIADRYPYRRVMIVCDLIRLVIFGGLALPIPVPVPVLLVLVFMAAMATPPFESSRSALLPSILDGDRYVVGIAVQSTTGQLAQVAGYLAGGAATAVDPRLALAIDAGTFAASALLLVTGVRPRPATQPDRAPARVLADTAAGFRLVFGRPRLRALALLVFALVTVPIVVEGLAAAWAAHLDAGSVGQGVLMASGPVGFAVGGVLIGRVATPGRRIRLVRPLAVLTALALTPALADPALPVAALLAAVAGFGASVLITLNGLFARQVPDGFRARAFGVMQGGVQLSQGIGVLAAGVIGAHLPVPDAVGVCGLAGLALVVAPLVTAGAGLPSEPCPTRQDPSSEP